MILMHIVVPNLYTLLSQILKDLLALSIKFKICIFLYSFAS